MKALLFSILLLSLGACDAPIRTRTAGAVQGIGSNNLNSNTNAAGNFSYSNGGTTAGTTTGTTTGSTTADASFPGCDLSAKYSTTDIGAFGVCQSTTSETLFKVQFTQAGNGSRNCLIPTYKDGSGSSTYLGQPQCTATTGSATTGTLYKNRTGYENYQINGVMVMKEALIQPYFKCMNASIQWLSQNCPYGAQTSPYCSSWVPRCAYWPNSPSNQNYNCVNEAAAYMRTVCEAFKSEYSGAYADIRTR